MGLLDILRRTPKKARPVGQRLEKSRPSEPTQSRARNLWVKGSIFLLLVLLTVAAFPRGNYYRYAVQVGDEWRGETIVAPLDPATDAARAARASSDGSLADHGQGGMLVDALFGSGLARPLAPEIVRLLADEAQRHAYRIAIDVPSGIDSDTGAALNEGLPAYDLTLALGAWKPAHALMPAMAAMGEIRLVPIGVAEMPGAARLLGPPKLGRPGYHDHKYTRGLVLVDPPYEVQDVDDVLAALVGWLAPGAMVVLERSKRSEEPRWPAVFEETWERRYGETILYIGVTHDEESA